MRLAARALAEGKRSLIELALSLGYNSQSAFSHAFKREIGRSPLHYQQALRVSTEAQYPQTNAWSSELS
jgi:AraC-like DNA-binding protein